MSNIHGFGDIEAAPSRGGAGRPNGLAQGYAQQDAAYPQGIPLAPQSNGLIPSISQRLVPRFSKKTFTFFISMVDIFMMLVTLIVGAATDNGAFVAGNAMGGPSSYTLYKMGGMYCGNNPAMEGVQDGAVWRLLTPIVLHAGLLHLFSNLFFQMHFGFTFEMRWTMKRFIAVYLITGLGASLLSCMSHVGKADAPVSVGASGALFGLLGADISYLIMNWSDIPNQKMEMICICLVVILNFLFSIGSSATDPTAPAIDNFAHLGGLVTGLFCAPVVCPIITQQPKTRLFQAIAIFAWFAFFLSLILAIFL